VANVLPVPHYRQLADGYCLPACAQMVLAHLGIFRSQEELAGLLNVRAEVGARSSSITRLASKTIAVHYAGGGFADLAVWLSKGAAIIAFIQAGELSYWQGNRFQHAVVIVGFDENDIYLLDPAFESALVRVDREEFLLAWDEMDNTYAALTQT
jgi:ABC-type bacteriocin/lantibiotic exporter with double-glycine peptidase domain